MRQGDAAFTDLPASRHVPKHHPRIMAAGAVDEASSAIGFARSQRPIEKCGGRKLPLSLREAQRCLVLIGAQAAGVKGMGPAILAEQVVLEKACETLQARISMPKEFIIPGENPQEAALHLARTACRRAETLISPLSGCAESKLYINRLSKYLFLLALLNR